MTGNVGRQNEQGSIFFGKKESLPLSFIATAAHACVHRCTFYSQTPAISANASLRNKIQRIRLNQKRKLYAGLLCCAAITSQVLTCREIL